MDGVGGVGGPYPLKFLLDCLVKTIKGRRTKRVFKF